MKLNLVRASVYNVLAIPRARLRRALNRDPCSDLAYGRRAVPPVAIDPVDVNEALAAMAEIVHP